MLKKRKTQTTKTEQQKLLRHPILVDRRDIGLLVVDVQEKFAPVIYNFDQVVKNTCNLIKAFQMFQLPLLVTEQYPQGLGKTVQDITACFPILEVTEKLTFSCLQNTQFVMKLEDMEVKRLVVCGIEAHVCVYQTVLDLLHWGYQVWVPRDATGSRAEYNHELALHRMEQAGAVITSLEMLLFEMAFQAGTESFRVIRDMVRVKGPNEQ